MKTGATPFDQVPIQMPSVKLRRVLIADNSITSAKIADGTITNVDINSTAAIDLSKLATYPFGLADLAANSVDGTKIVDGSVASADIQDGTIQTTDIAVSTGASWESYDNLENARVEITTGNNPVLIMFSGTFFHESENGMAFVGLHIDDKCYLHTVRGGTSVFDNALFVLTFSCMPTLSAGTHTIQVVWGKGGPFGIPGSAWAYRWVLDVIELKR